MLARAEERQALESLLVTEQVEDMRSQLQAATEILIERTGLDNADVAQLIARRLEQKRSNGT